MAAETLRELREGRGLTLEELAEAAGLSKGFLSQLENGKVGIGLWSARMLADVLQVSMDDLAVLVDRARSTCVAVRKKIGVAYETEHQIVIVGAVPEGMEHSCDAMGCSSTGGHVLYRFAKPGWTGAR